MPQDLALGAVSRPGRGSRHDGGAVVQAGRRALGQLMCVDAFTRVLAHWRSAREHDAWGFFEQESSTTATPTPKLPGAPVLALLPAWVAKARMPFCLKASCSLLQPGGSSPEAVRGPGNGQ